MLVEAWRVIPVCKASGFMILPGEIYTLRNRSNSDLVSKNVRGQ